VHLRARHFLTKPFSAEKLLEKVTQVLGQETVRDRGRDRGSTTDRTVLIVHDEGLPRLLLKRHLAQFGWEVLEAGDGEQRVAIFRERPVGVVLLDVNLPGPMSGIDVYPRARRRPSTSR